MAQALRLPTLSLTGAVGLVSDDVSGLLDDNDDLWSVAGGLVGPVFDAGKRRRNVDVERARTEQLLRGYEQAVLVALREVENALIGYAQFRAESAARQRQVSAARSALELSRARYDGGVTSYLEVLDSERSLFQAELAASVVRRRQYTAFVQLYRALGGGWQLADQGPGAGKPGRDERGATASAKITP